MRVKLFLTLLASASVPMLAQQAATVTGVITDADTGAPIPGAVVSIPSQGISVTTGPAGDYRISNSRPGEVVLSVTAPGYLDGAVQTLVYDGSNQGVDCVMILDDNTSAYLSEGANDLLFDESFIDDDTEGSGQSISALTGSSDDVYYKFTRFGYKPLYSNYRGLNSSASETYINGMPMNDLIRGGFSFSQLGGMTSRAFRNNTTTTGLGAASYGFSGLGGSQNINTITENYSPGFNALVSYTNANYYARAMATYSTGLNANGLALTVSAIGRYSDEGIVDGTYYNSGGYFISLEKVFNPHHSITLTTWGAPTEQANSRAAVQEVFDLTGDNLYNPSWGWQSGKKRSDNIRKRFDPTVMLNWLYKDEKTTLNTGVAVRWLNFARTRVTYNQGNDPKPDYYKNLPSYWLTNAETPGMADYYTELWRDNIGGVRQINWDEFYEVNAVNNALNQGKPEEDRVGSTYMQQWEHSNQFNFIANSVLNRRLTDHMTLQAGVTFNFTKYHDYMTVKDLLGGEYWLDINTFADRDINNPLASVNIMQNDLDDPNRRVGVGDVFGHDYDITALKAQAFVQNQINTTHWDVNYGLQVSYEQFFRFGHMRNGRAPENSKGKSDTQRFDDAAVKVGATYKLNGRNYFTLRAQYGTEAPLIKDVYISPRISDDVVSGLTSARTFAADFAYNWNYRRFRGSVGVFFVNTTDAMERRGFYDETLNSYVNYAVTGVHRQNKGVELGMSYKILPSLTATFAGTYARYQYKNNPQGTRMSENGLFDPTTKTVYLKNYYSVSTPQTAFNIGLDWAAPKSWYLNVNASWLADYYVSLAYPYHETFEGVWESAGSVAEAEKIQKDFARQPKLANNWVLNASIGKSFRFAYKYYLNLNLSVSNILNNRNLVTNAYQQLRVDTRNYNANAYPYRLQYAQGTNVYFNVGFRF